MYYKQEIGKIGEDIATNYLLEKGYKIIERNFECRQGEIDIVAFKNNEIIFVEVKTRTNRKFGDAKEAVDVYKKKHLWDAGRYYIYLNHLMDAFIRFDVIEVYLFKKKAFINHIKKALEG